MSNCSEREKTEKFHQRLLAVTILLAELDEFDSEDEKSQKKEVSVRKRFEPKALNKNTFKELDGLRNEKTRDIAKSIPNVIKTTKVGLVSPKHANRTIYDDDVWLIQAESSSSLSSSRYSDHATGWDASGESEAPLYFSSISKKNKLKVSTV